MFKMAFEEEMKWNAQIILKKIVVSLLGFGIMAFGIAFSIKAALGTSPISSVPYVTGEIFMLSVGKTTIIMHCIFILIQILLLRKNYQIFQLSQLAVAFVFGFLTDFAVFCIQHVEVHTYIEQWGLCAIGILLVGIGVSLEVTADFVVVAGEGLVLAICESFHTKFGNTKILFDVTLVLTAIVLSLVFLGRLSGVREGTLAAALLVGQVSKLCMKHYDALRQWLKN
jgi:uncharacterized membrane protein YczE